MNGRASTSSRLCGRRRRRARPRRRRGQGHQVKLTSPVPGLAFPWEPPAPSLE